MSTFYDELETRSNAERESAQFETFTQLLHHALETSPYYREMLTPFSDLTEVDRTVLAQLPLTRKSDLFELQQNKLPFGGLTELSPPNLLRIFASPGPIYEPETRQPDCWRFARALFAAGVRSGDLLYNCFSYHFTPAGAMVENGAFALNCAVFPAGTGQTELQAQTIADLRPQTYVGTPSFLKIILAKGDELGLDLSSLTRGLVSGEYFSPELRREFSDRGIAVQQCYATADLGLIAYESNASAGMILDEGVIVEIVRPGTGDPVPEGEVGEVVVTCLNPDYPLIRFATGDLSALLPGQSECGRTNQQIKGWMGRADQSAKVRGLFVHPKQIAELVKRYDTVTKGRLLVTRNSRGLDEICLQVESEKNGSADFAAALKSSFHELTKLRTEVSFHQPDSLPNDGKVIADQRPIDG